jgi:hypothetical protein
MRHRKFSLLVFCTFVSLYNLDAQVKPGYNFGKITPADFNMSLEKFDSGANAVIITDIGRTGFEANNNGFFTLIFTRYMRVKIMNKNGFDVGNYTIYLYHDNEGSYEKLSSVKGSTFNLENGVVNETKLDDKSVFKENYSKHVDRQKFSMPALKEGAIYDLEYTIKSPFSSQLQPWAFQGEYPRIRSEYTVTIAFPFHYVMLVKGDQNFDVNTNKTVFESYTIRENNGTGRDELTQLSGNSIQQHWVKKNVPALREELYTTTLDNYNSGVSFQLNYFQWTNESERHNHMNTWPAVTKTLLEDEEFGLMLSRENSWMADELNIIMAGANSDEQKTYKIYSYVRDNFKSSSNEGLYAHSSLKDIFKKREGNVAEINLLLIAMLRKAGITADPMILSTRDNGIANVNYPLMREYNYVICVVYLTGKFFELDASQPYIGFGQLPDACYNGFGHIINEQKPLPVELSADSVSESSLTSVLIFNDDKGKSSGGYKCIFGKSGSYDTRQEIFGSSQKTCEKKIQTSAGSDISIENFGVDSLKKYDFPLTLHYDFDLNNVASSDILYFSPMMGEEYKTNPFKSIERHYPVEMPYRIDETYILTMDIPEGYVIDEIPKSARVMYNENEGMFEYLIQKGETNLQLRVRLKLNKAFFPTDEYNTLRDFFAYVVKKESEQIVFKKMK